MSPSTRVRASPFLPDDAQIAVGVRQGSELKEQINEILAGISAEERNNIMDAVVLAQPLSE